MNRPDDPTFEIRDALDREVRRVFDPARLAAGLEEGQAHATRMRARRNRGPFGRVPATVQWIGVAAAMIAAVTGLRSLYLELAAPEPAPRAVERAASETPPFRPELVATPGRAERIVEQDPARSVQPTDTETPTEPRSATSREPEQPIDPPPSSAIVTAETADDPVSLPRAGRPSMPGNQQAPLATTLPGADPHEPAVARRSPPGSSEQRDVPAPAPSRSREERGVAATFPGTVPEPGGVRLTDLRAGGSIGLREIPVLGATLLTIRGDDGSPVPRSDTRPLEPLPEPEGAVSAREGSYFFRVLVGSAFDLLPEDEHATLGDGFEVVPLADLEPWDFSGARSRFLETEFDLRSIVALDGVRIPVESGPSGATLLAVGGGRLYRVTVRARAAELDGRHRMSVELSLPGRKRGARVLLGSTIEIDDDRVAVLAVPEMVLTGRESGPELATGVVFVVVSPQFGPMAETLDALHRSALVEKPDQQPILLEAYDPIYPVEAVEHDVHGDVRLRVVVGRNGDVESVTVVELPQGDGAEYLAAAAAGAVRAWRYIPAQHRGEDAAAYVDVTLAF